MERRTFFKKLLAIAAAITSIEPATLLADVPQMSWELHELGPNEIWALPPGWKMNQLAPEYIEAVRRNSLNLMPTLFVSIPEQFIEA